MKCKKHDAEMVPVYDTGPDEETILDGWACVECLSEKPIRIPIRFIESKGEVK